MSPYQYYLIWCYTVSKEEVGGKKNLAWPFSYLLCIFFTLLRRINSAPWCPTAASVSNYRKCRLWVKETTKTCPSSTAVNPQQQQKQQPQLSAVTSDESPGRPTAIWFPSSLRPTTQRNATESTGTHCRASLYGDVSGAGKPAPAHPRSAKVQAEAAALWVGKASNAFCLLYKGNWNGSPLYFGWRQSRKVFINISTF